MGGSYVRSALFIDFDNVFGALLGVDEGAALAFAEDPSVWLTDLLGRDVDRQWLVRRCYMNPSGSVANPSAVDGDTRTQRLYFSRYRPFFTKAGFEVIDCPSLTQRAKNGADIRIALDVMEALVAPTRYDEFILASGDSDFTPLLVKLRAADRRTTIVSASPVAAAFEAVADRHIGLQKLLDLLAPDTVLNGDQGDADSGAVGPVETSLAKVDTNAAPAYEKFRSAVQRRLSQSNDPLNLARLAAEVRREGLAHESWFGYSTFSGALSALGLGDVEISAHWIWDRSRHTAPESERDSADLPDPVARLCAVLGLPRLRAELWPHVYRALAAYPQEHDFNLTEVTKWSRDWLADQDIDVGRNAFGYVVRGAMTGGASLKRRPRPTADEIATAFVTSTLDRAGAAQLDFTTDEASVVTEWLAAPGDADLA